MTARRVQKVLWMYRPFKWSPLLILAHVNPNYIDMSIYLSNLVPQRDPAEKRWKNRLDLQGVELGEIKVATQPIA